MSIEERKNLYLRLDRLIRMKVPGRATELAERLNVSRSTFFRCLDEMKMMGAPITYDEICGRYVYTKLGRFQFGFLSKEDTRTLSGGFLKNFQNYFTGLRF